MWKTDHTFLWNNDGLRGHCVFQVKKSAPAGGDDLLRMVLGCVNGWTSSGTL